MATTTESDIPLTFRSTHTKDRFYEGLEAYHQQLDAYNREFDPQRDLSIHWQKHLCDLAKVISFPEVLQHRNFSGICAHPWFYWVLTQFDNKQVMSRRDLWNRYCAQFHPPTEVKTWAIHQRQEFWNYISALASLDILILTEYYLPEEEYEHYCIRQYGYIEIYSIPFLDQQLEVGKLIVKQIFRHEKRNRGWRIRPWNIVEQEAQLIGEKKGLIDYHRKKKKQALEAQDKVVPSKDPVSSEPDLKDVNRKIKLKKATILANDEVSKDPAYQKKNFEIQKANKIVGKQSGIESTIIHQGIQTIKIKARDEARSRCVYKLAKYTKKADPAKTTDIVPYNPDQPGGPEIQVEELDVPPCGKIAYKVCPRCDQGFCLKCADLHFICQGKYNQVRKMQDLNINKINEADLPEFLANNNAFSTISEGPILEALPDESDSSEFS